MYSLGCRPVTDSLPKRVYPTDTLASNSSEGGASDRLTPVFQGSITQQGIEASDCFMTLYGLFFIESYNVITWELFLPNQ